MDGLERKAPATDFPWGVVVGQFVDAEGRRRESALLPTAAGGLLVCYRSEAAEPALRVVETAALSLYDAVPHWAMEVHVVDYSIRKRFPDLARLALLKHYRLHDGPRAVLDFLADVELQERYRHHEILGDALGNLSQFNRQAQHPEKYLVAVVNLNDLLRDRTVNFEWFIRILDAGADAGIFFVCHVDLDFVAAEGPERDPAVLMRALCARLPQVQVEGAELASAKVQVEGPLAASLRGFLAQFRFTLEPHAQPLAPLVEYRMAMAQQSQSGRKDFLRVPVGFTKDGRHELAFSLGDASDCYHAFIVGMPGSGKTTLLNQLIVGIARRYGIEELRLYLMDYKQGVEFQVFEHHPNCERIFLDHKDPGAAHRMLADFVDAIEARAVAFKEKSVNDIDAYNGKAGVQRLPRLLLIVDEVQCLFTQDKFGQAFNDLLKRVVKQGRAFGVHIILCTQTLLNMNIDRDLMSQISLRIAFKLSNEVDCDKIFGYGNMAPRLLRKFEFVSNADSGYKPSNQLGQTEPLTGIVQELAALRLARGEENCLTPVLISQCRDGGEKMDGMQASSTAEPGQATRPGNGGDAAASDGAASAEKAAWFDDMEAHAMGAFF